MKQQSAARGRPRRRGLTLVEVAGAMMVIAAALTLLSTTLAVTAAQRRVMSHRQLATQEAANAIERLAAVKFDKLNQQAASALTLSAAAQRLPGSELTVTISPADAGGISGKQIASVVSWKQAGQTQKVGMVAWRYPHAPADDSSRDEE